jgi:hypothetical protein
MAIIIEERGTQSCWTMIPSSGADDPAVTASSKRSSNGPDVIVGPADAKGEACKLCTSPEARASRKRSKRETASAKVVGMVL